MEKMDPSLEEASRVAGASPLKTLCKVTLPLMLPSVIAGGVLVFINAASSFGIPAMIGMPAQTKSPCFGKAKMGVNSNILLMNYNDVPVNLQTF